MIRIRNKHIRSIILFPHLLLFAACAEPDPAVVPGVSLELAQHRSATISDVNYALTLAIPDNREEPIDGHIVVSFRLTDDSVPLQLDFRENADRIQTVATTALRRRSGSTTNISLFRSATGGRSQCDRNRFFCRFDLSQSEPGISLHIVRAGPGTNGFSAFRPARSQSDV